MKYQLVIFDLDGTILDTLDDLADSTNAVLLKNGFPLRKREEVRAFVGNGIQKLIERAVPAGTLEETTQKVLADFKKYYGTHCADKTKPYDGIVKLIGQLRAEGYKTAVVSNKADFAVQELCQQYFPDLFDYVVGERQGVRKKPAPDSVNEVLKKLGIARTDAVYVGDSEVDVETADNADMEQIIVTWGFRDREFLKKHGAKVLISTVEQLYEILNDKNIKKKPEDGVTIGQPFSKGMGGCDNFRIPGIVTLKDKTLLASADARWNLEKDGGGSALVVSRSVDGGATWHYSFVGYLQDSGNTWNPDASTLMDPLLISDGKDVYLFADLFPAGYSISVESTTNKFSVTESGFNKNGDLLLSKDERKTYAYYLRNGKIYREGDREVEGYHVDGWFNLYLNETYLTNLFFENSPFQTYPTSYICMMHSQDGGKSWSNPNLLNIKPQGIVWMVMGPGKGISTKEGTLMFSVYDGNSVYLCYSKDKGNTWSLVQTKDANGESQLVELEDGTIRMFVRSIGVNKIQYIDFVWKDNTYCPQHIVNTGIDNFSNCMISVLKYSAKIEDKEVLLISCPSDTTRGTWGGRFQGNIYVFLLDNENNMELIHKYQINEGFFAYSCMVECADGSIDMLYEDNCIHFAAGNYEGPCSHIMYKKQIKSKKQIICS